MKILGIIPSRYASSRFPGKPLVMIDGKSMIQRVYEQALKCKELSSVIIATDSEVIEKHIKAFQGNVVITSIHHKSGTERCLEVLEKFRGDQNDFFDIIINIQGDEPFFDPHQISELTDCFRNEDVQIATLVKKIKSNEELSNPNVVKVIFDKNFKAIYFSRLPIPFCRSKDTRVCLKERSYFKHIGIYAYRSKALREIGTLTMSPLEKAESLEQLRWIENGYPIYVRETELESFAIDTPADLLKITNTIDNS
jgi:3-deoxy-manno-octulosonate cytidylyltransferase (CMP-KDO synthetase)